MSVLQDNCTASSGGGASPGVPLRFIVVMGLVAGVVFTGESCVIFAVRRVSLY